MLWGPAGTHVHGCCRTRPPTGVHGHGRASASCTARPVSANRSAAASTALPLSGKPRSPCELRAPECPVSTPEVSANEWCSWTASGHPNARDPGSGGAWRPGRPPARRASRSGAVRRRTRHRCRRSRRARRSRTARPFSATRRREATSICTPRVRGRRGEEEERRTSRCRRCGRPARRRGLRRARPRPSGGSTLGSRPDRSWLLPGQQLDGLLYRRRVGPAAQEHRSNCRRPAAGLRTRCAMRRPLSALTPGPAGASRPASRRRPRRRPRSGSALPSSPRWRAPVEPGGQRPGSSRCSRPAMPDPVRGLADESASCTGTRPSRRGRSGGTGLRSRSATTAWTACDAPWPGWRGSCRGRGR